MEYEQFDSFEAMLDAIDRNRMYADAKVTPYQAAAKPGDFYRQNTPYGFSIFGEILPDPEPRPPEHRYYRFVQAYSVACPEGEMGDMHVSVIDRILSSAEFQATKERLWADDEITNQDSQ